MTGCCRQRFDPQSHPKKSSWSCLCLFLKFLPMTQYSNPTRTPWKRERLYLYCLFFKLFHSLQWLLIYASMCIWRNDFTKGFLRDIASLICKYNFLSILWGVHHICLPIDLYNRLSIHLSFHQSIYILSIFSGVSKSIHLSLYLSLYLSDIFHSIL